MNFIHECKVYGIDPFVALGFISIDAMLFGLEAVTAGLAVPITIFIAFLFSSGAILVQKYGHKEHWGVAIGKGLLLGVLTAIPTSLPSVLTLGWGASGAIGFFDKKQINKGEEK